MSSKLAACWWCFWLCQGSFLATWEPQMISNDGCLVQRAQQWQSLDRVEEKQLVLNCLDRSLLFVTLSFQVTNCLKMQLFVFWIKNSTQRRTPKNRRTIVRYPFLHIMLPVRRKPYIIIYRRYFINSRRLGGRVGTLLCWTGIGLDEATAKEIVGRRVRATWVFRQDVIKEWKDDFNIYRVKCMYYVLLSFILIFTGLVIAK